MISKNTLQNLINLAKTCHFQHKSPKEFAIKAAILTASESASNYQTDSYNAAAFVAATSFIELAGLSAQVAASGIQNQALLSENSKRGQGALNRQDFLELSNKINNIPLRQDAFDLYNQSFDAMHSETNRQALKAACILYTFSFASAYSAFTHALVVSARANPKNQNYVFNKAVTTKLTNSFMCEPIEPGFFMKVMTSNTTKALAVLLMTASLAALTAGISMALSPAAAAVAIEAGIGVSQASLIGAGASGLASSSALFGGRFFAHRSINTSNEKGQKALMDAIDVNGQASLQEVSLN